MWSLSERSAQRSIIAGKAHLVRYEDVVDQGPGILNRLELSSVNIPSNDTASPVTTSGREQLSVSQRLNDWRSRLTRTEIDTIESVCNELFPDNGYFDRDASKSGTYSR